jgi:nickel superoxide dismutase
MRNIFVLFILVFAISISCNAQSLQNLDNHTGSEAISQLQKEINALDDDHCEVPCGIYGDSLRVALLKEHTKTIEKGINQINSLSKDSQPNYNQIVRWVMNKETHATEIQHIVSQYFLHQRVKMITKDSGKKAEAKYYAQLESLHSISVMAMKTKQSTDLGNIAKLKKAIHDFEHAYFDNHKH